MIAFFFAEPKWAKSLSTIQDSLFFTTSGHILQGNQSRSFELFSNGVADLTQDPMQMLEADALLNASFQTWARHYPDGHSLSLLHAKARLWVARLSSELERNKVNSAVFLIGPPHHIDSVVCHVACQLLKIRTIYLYPEPTEGRLLPVELSLPIQQVQPLGFVVSDFNHETAVLEYAQGSLEGSPPKLNSTIHKCDNLFPSGVLAALFEWAMNFASGLWTSIRRLRLQPQPTNLIHDLRVPSVSLIQRLRLLYRQARALKSLKLLSEKSPFIPTGEKIGKIILFAHLQPESSTFPEGGKTNFDHVEIIRKLRTYGWNQKIVYKEHPATLSYAVNGAPSDTGKSRSSDYYRALVELGCSLDFGQLPRLNPADIVMTVSGSVAIERALAGLPTVVAGRPWFESVPGVVLMTDNLGFLEEYRDLEASPDLARRAKSHLTHLLSKKTMINAQGAGFAGKPRGEPDVLTTLAEFSRLAACIRG